MKSSPRAPSATSLPRAPHDDASSRFAKYMITMGIRIACLVGMVFITPYGWYTWVLAAGAVLLPYIAVVIANVGQETHRTVAESPGRAIADPTPAAPPPPGGPTVIRISESTRPDPDAEENR